METCDEHRADEASNAHADVHEAEQCAFRVAQVFRDEHGHLGLDECHQRERRYQTEDDGVAGHRFPRNVGQPLSQVGERRLLLAPFPSLGELGAEREHEQDDDAVHHSLQQEVHLRPQQSDHAARDARPDHPHGVERHRVQRYGVHEPLARHRVAHERLPEGIVQRPPGAGQEREGVQVPQLYEPQLEDEREYDREEGQVELVQQENDAAVEFVGDDSRDGRPQHRQGAQPQHDGHLHRRPGHLVRQPTQRHLLDPGPAAHEEGAEPEEPVVAVAER